MPIQLSPPVIECEEYLRSRKKIVSVSLNSIGCPRVISWGIRLLILFVLWFEPLAAQTPASESLLYQGIAGYEAKQFPQAARKLEKYLASQPPLIGQAEGLCYLAEVRFELGDDLVACRTFKQADSLARLASLQIDTLHFYYLILQGMAASCSDNNEKNQYYQALLDFVEQKPAPSAKEKAAAYYGMAITHIRADNYAEAAHWLEKSIESRRAIGLDADLAEEYFTYAYLHYLNEDYYQAVINQQLGLNLLSKNNQATYFDHLTNLAAYYFDNRDLADAEKYLQQAAAFGQTHIDMSSPSWGFLYGIQQEIFSEQSLLDSLAQAINIASIYYEQYPANKTESYYHYHLNQAAALAYLQKDYSKAQQLIDQFFDIFGEAYPKSFQSMQFLQSKLHAARLEFGLAVAGIQQLLLGYTEDHVDLTAAQDPDYPFTVADFKPSVLAITYLKDKAAYYTAWHSQSKQAEQLSKSIRCIELADALISRAKGQNNQIGFRSQLNEISAELRKIAVENYFRLFKENQDPADLMAALNASEQVKYLAMVDKLRQNILSQNLGLPKDLLAEKRTLDSLLYAYHRKVSWQGLSDVQLQDNKHSIDSLFARSKLLRAEIQQRYPSYSALLYAPPQLSLGDIRRQLLGEGEVLLHFLEVGQDLYVIGISKQQLLFDKIRLAAPFARDARLLAQEMQELSTAVFPKLHYFHQQLLAPFQDFIGQQSLLIVPDSHLWYIPFPALLSRVPDLSMPANTHAYLVRERNIRHLFSLSVGLLQQELKRRHGVFPSKDFSMLGLNPVESKAIGKFAQLINPKTNEQAIRQLLPPKQLVYFTDQDATLEAFRKYAPRADLLHLFTHAVISEDYPDSTFLVFQTSASTQDGYDQLSTTEVLNSRLGTQLAVLAACSTAGGGLKRGLGVINLARAFAHAGCENMVVTLWNANDLAVDDILANFYDQILTKKVRQSTALNQAQRQYLASASLAGHPAYWASTVYIGEDSIFRQKLHISAFVLIPVVVILALSPLLFWIIKRRRKH